MTMMSTNDEAMTLKRARREMESSTLFRSTLPLITPPNDDQQIGYATTTSTPKESISSNSHRLPQLHHTPRQSRHSFWQQRQRDALGAGCSSPSSASSYSHDSECSSSTVGAVEETPLMDDQSYLIPVSRKAKQQGERNDGNDNREHQHGIVLQKVTNNHQQKRGTHRLSLQKDLNKTSQQVISNGKWGRETAHGKCGNNNWNTEAEHQRPSSTLPVLETLSRARRPYTSTSPTPIGMLSLEARQARLREARLRNEELKKSLESSSLSSRKRLLLRGQNKFGHGANVSQQDIPPDSNTAAVEEPQSTVAASTSSSVAEKSVSDENGPFNVNVNIRRSRLSRAFGSRTGRRADITNQNQKSTDHQTRSDTNRNKHTFVAKVGNLGTRVSSLLETRSSLKSRVDKILKSRKYGAEAKSKISWQVMLVLLVLRVSSRQERNLEYVYGPLTIYISELHRAIIGGLYFFAWRISQFQLTKCFFHTLAADDYKDPYTNLLTDNDELRGMFEDTYKSLEKMIMGIYHLDNKRGNNNQGGYDTSDDDDGLHEEWERLNSFEENQKLEDVTPTDEIKQILSDPIFGSYFETAIAETNLTRYAYIFAHEIDVTESSFDEDDDGLFDELWKLPMIEEELHRDLSRICLQDEVVGVSDKGMDHAPQGRPSNEFHAPQETPSNEFLTKGSDKGRSDNKTLPPNDQQQQEGRILPLDFHEMENKEAAMEAIYAAVRAMSSSYTESSESCDESESTYDTAAVRQDVQEALQRVVYGSDLPSDCDLDPVTLSRMIANDQLRLGHNKPTITVQDFENFFVVVGESSTPSSLSSPTCYALSAARKDSKSTATSLQNTASGVFNEAVATDPQSSSPDTGTSKKSFTASVVYEDFPSLFSSSSDSTAENQMEIDIFETFSDLPVLSQDDPAQEIRYHATGSRNNSKNLMGRPGCTFHKKEHPKQSQASTIQFHPNSAFDQIIVFEDNSSVLEGGQSFEPEAVQRYQMQLQTAGDLRLSDYLPEQRLGIPSDTSHNKKINEACISKHGFSSTRGCTPASQSLGEVAVRPCVDIGDGSVSKDAHHFEEPTSPLMAFIAGGIFFGLTCDGHGCKAGHTPKNINFENDLLLSVVNLNDAVSNDEALNQIYPRVMYPGGGDHEYKGGLEGSSGSEPSFQIIRSVGSTGTSDDIDVSNRERLWSMSPVVSSFGTCEASSPESTWSLDPVISPLKEGSQTDEHTHSGPFFFGSNMEVNRDCDENPSVASKRKSIFEAIGGNKEILGRGSSVDSEENEWHMFPTPRMTISDISDSGSESKSSSSAESDSMIIEECTTEFDTQKWTGENPALAYHLGLNKSSIQALCEDEIEVTLDSNEGGWAVGLPSPSCRIIVEDSEIEMELVLEPSMISSTVYEADEDEAHECSEEKPSEEDGGLPTSSQEMRSRDGICSLSDISESTASTSSTFTTEGETEFSYDSSEQSCEESIGDGSIPQFIWTGSVEEPDVSAIQYQAANHCGLLELKCEKPTSTSALVSDDQWTPSPRFELYRKALRIQLSSGKNDDWGTQIKSIGWRSPQTPLSADRDWAPSLEQELPMSPTPLSMDGVADDDWAPSLEQELPMSPTPLSMDGVADGDWAPSLEQELPVSPTPLSKVSAADDDWAPSLEQKVPVSPTPLSKVNAADDDWAPSVKQPKLPLPPITPSLMDADDDDDWEPSREQPKLPVTPRPWLTVGDGANPRIAVVDRLAPPYRAPLNDETEPLQETTFHNANYQQDDWDPPISKQADNKAQTSPPRGCRILPCGM